MINMSLNEWVFCVLGTVCCVYSWLADRRAARLQAQCEALLLQEANRAAKADWDLRPVRIATGMAVFRHEVEQAHRRQLREALQRHLAESRAHCLGCETEMSLNWQGVNPVSLPSLCTVCSVDNVLPMDAPEPAQASVMN